MPAVDEYSQALDYLRLLARQDFAEWWAVRGELTDAELRAAFAELAANYGDEAASAAVDYLVMSRSLDDELAGLPFPKRADPVGFEQAVASFAWAVNTSVENGRFVDSLAASKLFGVLDRLVGLPAHQTVVDTVLRDGTAFARVPEPGACAFCLMLGSRGAVYTAETVGRVNKFHDNCRCLGIECKRDGSDLPRINRELEELWVSSGSQNVVDFRLAVNTRREFASLGNPRNTQAYRLPSDVYRASIVRWQGMDRFYAQVQKVAQGHGDNPDAVAVYRDLLRASKETPLERDVLMWRGVRNWHAEFGIESLDELEATQDFEFSRLKSLTTSRNQATNAFTTFGKAGALIKVKAKKGCPGVWLPANGDADMIEQQEFVVPPGSKMRVLRVERGKLPIIHVEVDYGKK